LMVLVSYFTSEVFGADAFVQLAVMPTSLAYIGVYVVFARCKLIH
jgi:hypothetical protein